LHQIARYNANSGKAFTFFVREAIELAQFASIPSANLEAGDILAGDPHELDLPRLRIARPDSIEIDHWVS